MEAGAQVYLRDIDDILSLSPMFRSLMTAPSLSCARRVGSGRSTLTFALWKNQRLRVLSHLVKFSPGKLSCCGAFPLGRPTQVLRVAISQNRWWS